MKVRIRGRVNVRFRVNIRVKIRSREAVQAIICLTTPDPREREVPWVG